MYKEGLIGNISCILADLLRVLKDKLDPGQAAFLKDLQTKTQNARSKAYYREIAQEIHHYLRARNRQTLRLSVEDQFYSKSIADIASCIESSLAYHAAVSDLPPLVEKRLYKDEKRYKELVTNCNATFILSMKPSRDFRYGDSLGNCFGYFVEWARDFLAGAKVFGVDPLQEPLFKIIKPTSFLARLYPDINQLAPLNQRIVESQNNQDKFKSGDKGRANLERDWMGRFRLCTDYQQMADNIIAAVNRNPNKLCGWMIRGFTEAHVVGCARDKAGNYHFLDSNIGWLKFKNAQDFKRSLIYCMKGYASDPKFKARFYSINIYQLETKKPGYFSSIRRFANNCIFLFSPVIGLLLLRDLAYSTLELMDLMSLGIVRKGFNLVCRLLLTEENLTLGVVPKVTQKDRLSQVKCDSRRARTMEDKLSPASASIRPSIAALVDYPAKDLESAERRAVKLVKEHKAKHSENLDRFLARGKSKAASSEVSGASSMKFFL